MATKKIKPLKMRHQRLRKKVAGTPQRPRLSIHFSGLHIYAQVIDDEIGKTIASVNTTEKEFTDDKTNRANMITAVTRILIEHYGSTSTRKSQSS